MICLFTFHRKSKSAHHKKQLARLQEKDPEFYNFLKENDKELLEFTDSDTGSEVDEADNDADDDYDDADNDNDNTKEDSDDDEEEESNVGVFDQWCHFVIIYFFFISD